MHCTICNSQHINTCATHTNVIQRTSQKITETPIKIAWSILHTSESTPLMMLFVLFFFLCCIQQSLVSTLISQCPVCSNPTSTTRKCTANEQCHCFAQYPGAPLMFLVQLFKCESLLFLQDQAKHSLHHWDCICNWDGPYRLLAKPAFHAHPRTDQGLHVYVWVTHNSNRNFWSVKHCQGCHSTASVPPGKLFYLFVCAACKIRHWIKDSMCR